jgi:hypothetical protein
VEIGREPIDRGPRAAMSRHRNMDTLRTVFEEICRRYPEIVTGVRRTLERRIANWRALHGPSRDAVFRQEHPGTDGTIGLFGQPTMIRIGQLILFSSKTGDAWLLDPSDHRSTGRSIHPRALAGQRPVRIKGPVSKRLFDCACLGVDGALTDFESGTQFRVRHVR